MTYISMSEGEQLTLLSGGWESWAIRFQREDGSEVELRIEDGYDGPEMAWKSVPKRRQR